MIGFLRQIGRGIDAGKLLEIMDEVHLIKIAAASRHVHPGKFRAAANLLQNLLKTSNAGKEFRSKTNFIGEKLNEAA